MTEEQLIQEYSDCIYPQIAKALIDETKTMVIDKAYDIYCKNCQNAIKTMKGVEHCREICTQFNLFKKSMEE